MLWMRSLLKSARSFTASIILGYRHHLYHIWDVVLLAIFCLPLQKYPNFSQWLVFTKSWLGPFKISFRKAVTFISSLRYCIDVGVGQPNAQWKFITFINGHWPKAILSVRNLGIYEKVCFNFLFIVVVTRDSKRSQNCWVIWIGTYCNTKSIDW